METTAPADFFGSGGELQSSSGQVGSAVVQ